MDAIGSDLKESLFRVSEQAFHEDPAAPVPPVSYELPDGSSIQIGGDRFRVPELMFQPQLIAAYPGRRHAPIPCQIVFRLTCSDLER